MCVYTWMSDGCSKERGREHSLRLSCVYTWVSDGCSQARPQEIQMEVGLFLTRTFMDKSDFQERTL